MDTRFLQPRRSATDSRSRGFREIMAESGDENEMLNESQEIHNEDFTEEEGGENSSDPEWWMLTFLLHKILLFSQKLKKMII